MSATVSVPDWLVLHDGSFRPGIRPETTFVLVGGQPLYLLNVRPAAGQFACAVSNTVNGKRLDNKANSYPTAEGAFTGGLEQLRNVLGW